MYRLVGLSVYMSICLSVCLFIYFKAYWHIDGLHGSTVIWYNSTFFLFFSSLKEITTEHYVELLFQDGCYHPDISNWYPPPPPPENTWIKTCYANHE